MALVVGLLLNWKPAGSGALSALARAIACRGGAVALPLACSALRKLWMMCSLQMHMMLAQAQAHAPAQAQAQVQVQACDKELVLMLMRYLMHCRIH